MTELRLQLQGLSDQLALKDTQMQTLALGGATAAHLASEINNSRYIPSPQPLRCIGVL